MRELIKQLLRENLLNEALTNVDNDVDIIYNKYFNSLIGTAQNGRLIEKDFFNTVTIDTSILVSDIAKIGHKYNPCSIVINEPRGNFYSPNEKLIGLGYGELYRSFLRYHLPSNYNHLADESGNYSTFKLEFTEERIKGSIHHELAHWIDDTNNNFHIKKLLSKNDSGEKKYNYNERYTSNVELQAVIHNIHQLKKKHHGIWDIISFNEMVELLPFLRRLRKNLKPDFYIKWKRSIILRMNREGLLGKNMTNTN
jgi:hypothetical protein